MDPRRNPYSPGAGLRPFELVGRERELEAFDVLRARAVKGRQSKSIILNGLRGVGKTVLLIEMAHRARQEGWIVAKIEADLGAGRRSLREQAAQSLTTALRQVQGKSAKSGRLAAALRTFKSFSVTAKPDGTVGVGFEVDQLHARGGTGDLRADLTDLALDLGAAARELDAGVCLFVDEMQHLDIGELGALCQACHECGQQEVPFYIVGAGLPNLPGVLAEARSYAERLFDYLRVDRLDLADARQALVEPALSEGVKWTVDATKRIVDASDGYPYFLQEFGWATWEAAIDSPIRARDAEEGLRLGFERLDGGFFRARWERATMAEREYLTAMAADGDGPSSSGEVARRMDRKPASLGPVRANLIAKGLVYAPDHGRIAFTVPGMATFIARQP